MVSRPRALLAAGLIALASLIGVAAVLIAGRGATTHDAGQNARTRRAAPTTTTPAPTTSSVPAPTTSAIPTPTTATTGVPGSVAGSATVPSVAPAPVLVDPSPQMRAAAAGYLVARENAVSFDQPTITSWLERAKPYLTASAHAGLVQAADGAHAGYVYSQMHLNAWKLATTVSCAVDQAASTPTPTMTTLTCTVIDDTVTQGGASVPASAVPTPWPYNTTQPPAILVMELVGPTWLVGADRTGQ